MELYTPFPDASFDEGNLLDFAWCLYCAMEEKPYYTELKDLVSHHVGHFQSISPVFVDDDTALRYLLRWVRDEQPLKWLRKDRTLGEKIRLKPQTIDRLVRLVCDEEVDKAMRLSVVEGFTFHLAKQQASPHFLSRQQALSNGQWLSGDQVSRLKRVSQRQIDESPGFYHDGHYFSAEVVEVICDLALRQGLKIQAIKEMRSHCGIGLKEAKLAVEEIMRNPHMLNNTTYRLYQGPAPLHKVARERLDRCIQELLIVRPFYWLLLSELCIVEDHSIDTMAVGLNRTGRMFLFYNPTFVMELLRIHCQAVLIHEINHILFGHLTHFPPGHKEFPLAWKLACESSANEYIPFPLPGNPITAEMLELPPKEGTHQRFRRLCERDDLDQYAHLMRSETFMATPLVDEPRHHRDRMHAGDFRLPTGTLIEAAKLSAAESRRNQMADLADAIKRQGIDRLDKLSIHLSPEGISQLPWPELLRKLAEQNRERYTTRRYPNRRHPHKIGIVPGRRSRRTKRQILVAIDTSASMTEWELSMVMDELVDLLQLEVRLLCVQCDTSICEMRWLQSHERITELKGRGGTDLRPPFANDILHRHDISMIVYFTDGYGPAPKVPPKGIDVLWVLTGYSPTVPASYGDVACIKPPDQRNRVQHKA